MPRRVPAQSHLPGASATAPPARPAAGVERWLAQWAEDVTLLGRLPTVAQIADAAAFLASDGAAAITGAVVDLTCGNAVRNSAAALVGVLD
jgi:3-oxoacyl-[acyl-carrier protein] reductase